MNGSSIVHAQPCSPAIPHGLMSLAITSAGRRRRAPQLPACARSASRPGSRTSPSRRRHGTIADRRKADVASSSLLAPGCNTGEATGDSYAGVESLRGSSFDDTQSGDAGNNNIEGAAGADRITGNGGTDYASYAHSSAGVAVDLAFDITMGGEAAGDILFAS